LAIAAKCLASSRAFAKHLSENTHRIILLGVGLSNAMAAFSAAMIAQNQAGAFFQRMPLQ